MEKITKEKVNDLLYKIMNEFDNELDYDYTSDYKKDFEEEDFNIMLEFLSRFLHKVELTMEDEFYD